jgi:cytochrome c
MKRILLMGVCTLLFACNSPTDQINTSDSLVLKALDTTEISANIDSPVNNNLPQIKEIAVISPELETAKPQIKEKPEVIVLKEAEKSDLVHIKNGELLISKSDCFACHKPQEKLLGPSYKEIAEKYEKTKANIEYLAGKVKVGGSGVWGAIPMSPHPSLSDDDARDMILYILSLK